MKKKQKWKMPADRYTGTSDVFLWLMIIEIIIFIIITIYGKELMHWIGTAIMPLIIYKTYSYYELYHISYSEAIRILGVEYEAMHVKVHLAYARRIDEINTYCVYNKKEKDELIKKVTEAYECWKQYTVWPLEKEIHLYEILNKFPELYKTNPELCGFYSMRKGGCRVPPYADWHRCYTAIQELRETKEKPDE